MRILVTCDPEIPVPPGQYGGVERLVSGLCCEYDKMGHEVFLVANKQSTEASVKKIFGWKVSHSRGIKNVIRNALQLNHIVRQVKPDVIHSFSRLLYVYPLFLSGYRVPVFQTYGRKISSKSTTLARWLCGKSINFCCCGAHMLNHLKNKSRWKVVYNFTDINLFSPESSDNHREHLVFLGRIEDIKGTYEAIQVAKKANMPLVIAGNVEQEHQTYFNTKVKPFIDNVRVKYIGPVDDRQKRKLLTHAKAFLFPIKWEEPFGIVMVEAMACGAPVLAFRRGSVPEIVKDGTGFISSNIAEMAENCNCLSQINQHYLHDYVKRNFSREVIARQYIDLFKKVLTCYQ